MIKKILFLILVLSVFCSTVGQRKFAADKYYEEYAFSKSAKLYQKLRDNDDTSYKVLQRLADSYYYNSNFEKAESAYKDFYKYHKDFFTPEHIYRYSQVLKSNGKVKQSDKWLLKLKNKEVYQKLVHSLELNRGYFTDYTNREKSYINVNSFSINSPNSDFGGYILNDTLYFASSRDFKKNKGVYKRTNQPFLNVYKTPIIATDTAYITNENPQIVKGMFSRYHESNPIITKDGSTMYFTRDNVDGKKLKSDKKKTTHLKIYRATKLEDNTWGNIEDLSFNSEDFSNGHPALSTDEKTLYFVSNRKGGYGKTDIYSISINNDGTFGEVLNAGEKINTEGREMFPFISKKRKMFFSSDGHLGLGGLDVFEVNIQEDDFIEPTNIGTPVNSSVDDFGFYVDEEKRLGLVSSNRVGGKGDDDIYAFKLYTCKTRILGKVTDAVTKKEIVKATVHLINERGDRVAVTKTNNQGDYLFDDVLCNKQYTLAVFKDDYRDKNQKLTTTNIDNVDNRQDFELDPLIQENQIVIKPIYFDFDKSNIREDAEYELENIITVLEDYPDMVIKIESHTDSRGSAQYNRKLSDRRAKSTRDYLITRGINSNRIESAIGYGESQLLNHCKNGNKSNCSEEEHQLNRRSYFYIVKGGGENIKVNQVEK
ncbi:WD40-like Beta Propeller Repeat [Tenacibaculum sp. MAR_2009_124]|uniref:OmpA family protein n=1 Tax=Tenacibaculum sp. MAR_2009_124 TaxID=1250059 RepID=UPI000897EF94|nr:OmpA family protein [Tenacibaculum sp. MAR_2009_124]SEC81198.1 WD40-like Beta Propeller Repeat [Tenacibaculum sp. MAR_2009_124]